MKLFEYTEDHIDLQPNASVEELSAEMEDHTQEIRALTTTLAASVESFHKLERLGEMEIDNHDLYTLTLEAITEPFGFPSGYQFTTESLGSRVKKFANKAWEKIKALWEKIKRLGRAIKEKLKAALGITDYKSMFSTAINAIDNQKEIVKSITDETRSKAVDNAFSQANKEVSRADTSKCDTYYTSGSKDMAKGLIAGTKDSDATFDEIIGHSNKYKLKGSTLTKTATNNPDVKMTLKKSFENAMPLEKTTQRMEKWIDSAYINAEFAARDADVEMNTIETNLLEIVGTAVRDWKLLNSILTASVHNARHIMMLESRAKSGRGTI